jgi:hypothetical protein
LNESNVLDFKTATPNATHNWENLVLGQSETKLDLDEKVTARILEAFNPTMGKDGKGIKIPLVELRPSDNTVRFYLDDTKSNAELASFRTNSAEQITGEIGTKSGGLDVQVRIYQLDLLIPQANFNTVLKNLSKLPAGEVILPTPYSAQEKFSTWITDANTSAKLYLHQFWDQCVRADNKRIDINIQGDVLSALDVPLNDTIFRPSLGSCTNPNCPLLVLLEDVGIHEDFKNAVKEGGHSELERPLVEGDKQIVDVLQTDRLPSDDDHGAHLAGLIAAQDNGYGLIGIHPGAHLVILGWDPNSIYQKAGKLDRYDGGKIYVFASQWPWMKVGPGPPDGKPAGSRDQHRFKASLGSSRRREQIRRAGQHGRSCLSIRPDEYGRFGKCDRRDRI